MCPALTVLQLDTDFPRIAGDVGCPETYLGDIDVIRINAATVAQIVTNRPEHIGIAPFETALRAARGPVVVTSCGFLSYWQTHLAAQTSKPFISSSLIALDLLAQHYDPEELLILTFDADSLTTAHLGAHPNYAKSIVGLPKACHLREVISKNESQLDYNRALAEITEFVSAQITPRHRHILLECTNLPPYKAALKARLGLPITDILTLIESTCAGTVKPEFL